MNKRTYTDTSRLFIYLAFTFLLTFIWFMIANPDGKTWDEMGQARQSLMALGMIFPVISHVLTRIITREGFAFGGSNSSYFGMTFSGGKWKYYVIACFIPWIYTELGNIIELALCPSRFDPKYYLSLGIEKRLLVLLPVNAIVTGIIGSFAAFGEEGGWRGYMMPKLIKIMGRKRALLLGGIIWGLWHAPLTCIGHNFGTDYPGFPYVGILLMCIFCTLLGILLTFLTEMSGSVWPAVFVHAIGNASPSILQGYINPDKAASVMIHPGWIGMVVSLVIVIIPLIRSWKKSFCPIFSVSDSE